MQIIQLDQSRVRLEQGLDPTSGQPTLRAHAEIQRAELDAWLADLGEFACQCWAFNGEGIEGNDELANEIVHKLRGNKEENDSEDEEDEEEDDEEEDNGLGPSTSTKMALNTTMATSNAPSMGAIRSETARIRLACESILNAQTILICVKSFIYSIHCRNI
jgi:hypothetical protein